MKKLWLLVLVVLVLLFGSVFIFGNNFISGGAVNEEGDISETKVVLHLFYGRGCPHCGQMESFLKEMQSDYSGIKIEEHEVYFDNEERQFFQEMSETFGHSIEGVPTVFIDEKVIVGYSNSIADSLEREIERCLSEECADPAERIDGGVEDVTQISGDSSPSESPEKTALKEKLTIPAVLSAAAVDAINPCAFAVLIILLTTILAAKIKRRILGAGLAFTLSIFISYLLMGVGLYSAIQATGISHWFYIIVGVLAILIGLFNLKDYLWYGKWFKMEVPESWRPRMKALIKGVTSVPGAFLIGFVVSLFLLPCTSGPYIVILGLLAKAATRSYAFGLLLIYNLIFILPMVIITLLIYFGLTTVEEAEEWRKSKLKVLHLIAGAVMVLLGIGMLLSVYFGWI